MLPRTFRNSASLRAAWALGLGGVAFALGNLILAKALPSAQYGILSLLIGIVSVASLAAPLGLDLVVARRGLVLGPRLRLGVLGTCTAMGLVTAVIGSVLYGLPFSLLITLLVATVAAGAIQAGVAHFQGRQNFALAAWLLQTPNAVLIPVALITLICGFDTAVTPSILLAATLSVGAAVTWYLVVASEPARIVEPPVLTLWREALALVAITVASGVFLQLERLVLGPTVGVHALALFGVLASLVGSPYRMIQGAVLFTLIPGLRAAADIAARRRLLLHEMLTVAVVLAMGSGVIWIAAPPIAHAFLSGRYDLTSALLWAAIVSGLLKVCSAFATSVAVALGDERDLRRVSATAWLSIGVAVVGAFTAAQWGVAGVLYGISLGWLLRALAAAWIAAPHLLQVRGDLPHPVR
jgi:O-antigen/teichoic acid export membrane protein